MRQSLGAMELAEEEDFLTTSGKALDGIARGRSPEMSQPKFNNLNLKKARPQTAKPIKEDDGFGEFEEDDDAAGDQALPDAKPFMAPNLSKKQRP